MSESKFKLKNVSEPNLLRDLFPYDTVCKLTFDNKNVSMDMPKEIFITDTTFRDGQQARPPYKIEQIVKIYKLLHLLGGPKGIIRQSEFFLYTEKDQKAVEKCLEKGYEFPEVTGWIRAVKKDFQLVKDIGLKETGILTSVSDYHIFLKLKKNRKEAMEAYLDVVRAAIEAGVKPRCHFEDVTRADIYGFCVPFAIELMKLSKESGMPVKIRLCDTMGYGVPFANACLPRSVPKLIQAFRKDAGVPADMLEWHGHNDFHKVLVNGTAAWLYGCGAINGALLGLGERTGNPPIEGLIIDYISMMGNNDIDTTVITDIANYFNKEMNVHIPDNYPFVGSEFNSTKAGIHADGISKNEEIYNIFDTTTLLKRPPVVAITDKSGLSGIAHWLNKQPRFINYRRVSKFHPGIAKINKWVQDQYDDGRVTFITNTEMEKLAAKHLPEYYISGLDRIKDKARHIAEDIIKALCRKSEIKSMDHKIQEPALSEFINDNPFIQFAYITNDAGVKITKNITEHINRSAYERIGLHEDFSSRSWFRGPMTDGKVHVTDIFTSTITEELCITVSAPIREKATGIIKGVLGLDIKFEHLAKTEGEKE
ncbi:histone-lysine N-methyltransferase [Thermodesulfobacteriota bacterium]